MQHSGGNLEVAVWRGDGAGGDYSSYSVPVQESQTILDVVTWIQHRLEPGLTYRFACRVGMCGSCAMMVNGKPRWTCRTHVQKVVDGNSLTIAPLRNLPVIKDLVTDMSEFFAKWLKAEGIFHPTSTRHEAMAPIPPNDPAISSFKDSEDSGPGTTVIQKRDHKLVLNGTAPNTLTPPELPGPRPFCWSKMKMSCADS